jgi:RND family efflux transporter MFP subunit
MLPRRLLAFVILLGALPLAGACSGESPVGAADPETRVPATVQRAVAEADLATITLTPEAERRLGIQTRPIAIEEVSKTRTFGGEVIVPSGRAVIVSSPMTGTLAAPPGGLPQPGVPVRRGQAVFMLLPLLPGDRDLRIEAERDVAASMADATAARQRLERTERLLKEGAASQRAVEEARAQDAVASAALEAARNRLASVTRNRIGAGGELTIEAPLDGVLQALHAAPGQSVAPAAVLFEVVRLDMLWIRVPVYAGDVAGIDQSRPAAVSGLGDSPSTPSRVARRVAAPPSADPAAAAVDLFFELVNSAPPLRPGERVAVRLALSGGEAALVVPDSAVIYDIQGGTWIYEARPDHVYVRRRIEIATYVDDNAVLSRGPSQGTLVVTVGAAELFGTEFGTGH